MKRLISYISTLLLLVSCISDEVQFDGSSWMPSSEPRYIHMENTTISMEAKKGSHDAYVEAMSTPWHFSGQASWLTITPEEGTDDATVTITATENMSGDDLRTSLFWLSSSVDDYDYKAKVSVTQRAAAPHLTVSKSSLTMMATGESKEITVDKNISYTISKSSSATWLTVATSADSTRLTITAEPNPAATARNASITLSGKLTQVINLTQEAAGMSSTEYGPLDVDVKGADFSLLITSDAAWTASTNGSWFTVSPSEGTSGTTSVILSVSPNNATSARSGRIDFKIGSTEMFGVVINQEGIYCSVSPTSLSMGAVDGSRTLSVSSNTEWTVISKPSWITTDIESGSGDGVIHVTASEHTEREMRSGVIIIGVEGVTELEQSVYVSQSQHYLSISPKAFGELPSTGGTHKISIASDDIWKATKGESWLTLSADAGRGDMDVTMSVADNPSITRRSDTVLFTPTYAPPIEFVVRQASRYLSVNTTRVIFYWRGGESLPIAVTTDGTFAVTTDCNWLRIEQNGHSFTLIAEEHDAKEPRSAVITVALTGLLLGEMYSIEIPIVQRPNVPIDMTTFPDDLNWDIVGNTHASITITGYTTDESWDNLGDSSFGLNITFFGKDENWNNF